MADKGDKIMKIDFDTSFKALNGEDIPERPNEVEKDKNGKEVIKKKHPPFTLKTACANVLLNVNLDEIICPQCRHQIKVSEELSGEEKASRYQLANKIYNGDRPVDIGTKDIELLKSLIGKYYPPLTSGQAWAILDLHDTGEKKDKKLS